MPDPEQAGGWVGWLRRRRAERARAEVARALHRAVVARARRPHAYAELGVPDTPDGRFEMLGLETALVLRRLRALGAEGEALGRSLLEVLVEVLDRDLRELGVGDLSVGRYVRRLTQSLVARAAALDTALAAGDRTALEALLRRALWPADRSPDPAQLAALAAEVEERAARLDNLPPAVLLAGRLDPPGPGESR